MIIEIFGKDFCPYCDKAVRVAQQFIQETEISSYVVGGVKKDVDDKTLKGLSL